MLNVVEPAALYLRSVCLIHTACRGLRCHPLTCIVLKLRLVLIRVLPEEPFFQWLTAAGITLESGLNARAAIFEPARSISSVTTSPLQARLVV